VHTRQAHRHATVAGFDVVAQRRCAATSASCSEGPTLDEYLTAAQENLRFHAELYGVPREVVGGARRHRRARMDQVLEMVGLSDRRTSLVRTYSGGMKRRLEIGRGLLHAPCVLFLDEPTVGLDPQTRSSIWGYINELERRERITILLTTHYMDEAEYCDRIAIMNTGRIVVLDSPEALEASVGKDPVQIQTGDDAAAMAALEGRFGLPSAVREGQVTFSVASGEQLVPRLFSELGVPIRSVSVARPSLDDVAPSWASSSSSGPGCSGSPSGSSTDPSSHQRHQVAGAQVAALE